MKVLGLVVALASAMTLTSVAHAAPATGTAELEIVKDSRIGKALEGAGVKASALDPASGGRTITLPITALEVGPPISALANGGIQLKAGKRKAKLKRIELITAGDDSRLRGAIGGKVMTLFKAKGVLTQTGGADAPKLVLESGRLDLTSRAARTISRKLRIDRLPDANAGRLEVSIDLPPSSNPPVDTPPDETPPDEVPPQGEAYPYEAQCPVPGAAVQNTPQDAADPAAAPALDLPQGVASATAIEWGFLASFRNYVINVPTAGTIQTLDGATPSGANLAAPGAFVGYSTGDGEYEAGNEVSHSDDRLVASTTGTTLFCKPGHGFSVVMKNPSVTIDGSQSRLTMDVGANYGGSWHPFQRVDVATLDLSGVPAVPSGSGDTVTWANVPATMTAEGSKALALPNYPAGTQLDPVSVRASLERPFQEACSPPVDGGTLPTVDFALEPLPPLAGTQTNVGSISWGYRSATRTSVVGAMTPGAPPPSNPLPDDEAFSVFGGATQSNPTPDMTGAGKFWGFPVSEATYDNDGTPGDLTDDRLIARSNGALVMCNDHSGRGSYGLVISKPTVVIDGTDSRLTANLYSLKAQNWAGGRVEMLDLDMTGVTPADGGGGVITWPDISLNGGAGLKTQALSLVTAAGTNTGWDPMTISIDTTP